MYKLENRVEIAAKEELREVEIAKISVNPYQPRRHFDQEDLQELADSIKAVGLLHPPLVRPIPHSDEFELISGERRFRAASLAGMKTLSVIVRHTSSSLSAQAALIENIQRVDLNPLEVAKAMRSLIIEFSLSQDEMALRVGKKRSTVTNYLRLLTLPIHIQEAVSQNKISMGHAKAILGLEGCHKQMLLFELILRDDLSVRDAEAAAVRIGEKARKQTLNFATRDFYLEQLAEKIQEKLGTKVVIQGKGKKGRISINYYNLDDLDRLLCLFGIK
ncbi:MAG: ParB/RepB/Spo0J family partition protein [Parachlamydiaceae bacterium]|nr:ParB/RepB/Spo0J family partition protein [Parachlamydiaceae bacterium]